MRVCVWLIAFLVALGVDKRFKKKVPLNMTAIKIVDNHDNM